MDLAPLVRAVEVLMSPLEWGGRDAWLAESVVRVRAALGAEGRAEPSPPAGELEELLRLPGDTAGWLRIALDAGDGAGAGMPPAVAATDLTVVSLRCGLTAGLATLRRLCAWRSTLGEAFDDIETGMAIFETDRPVPAARNARWDVLLEAEPERERLLRLVALAVRTVSAGGTRESDDEVELAGRSYRLVASLAAAGALLPEPGVLLLMERVGPALPTTQELRISYGLRGREPQVALLAAQGLSNADIARRLRLSAHTVRHYLERVLDRLGLHSRKALALRLMVSGGERRG